MPFSIAIAFLDGAFLQAPVIFRISEFKRVRDVTVKEHGINKPYKGVYACVICGNEQVMDNSLEKEEVTEDETT